MLYDGAPIAGYLVVNDVSERSFQIERAGQWVKGKSAETFNPAGPWLATGLSHSIPLTWTAPPWFPSSPRSPS